MKITKALIGLTAFFMWGGIWSPPARAQAAAAYGVAASKSTAMGAKLRPLVAPKTAPLAKKSAVRSAPTLGDVLQDNRQKLEAKSGKTGGTLHVESVPAKATVSIDGAPVAYTPVDLKLPEGSHVVELKLPGFIAWRKDITVTREGNMLLKAELRTQYKSSETFISFK